MLMGAEPHKTPAPRSRMPATGASRPLPFGSTVLVVYEHFGVATAIAQRIMEFAAVELARTADAIVHLEQGRGYDLVVLCPYIGSADREELSRRCRAADPQPIAVNLLDGRASGMLEVWDPSSGLPMDVSELGEDPRRAAAVDLLAALAGREGAEPGTAGRGAVAGT
jgi:hypothetical protein